MNRDTYNETIKKNNNRPRQYSSFGGASDAG